MPLERTDRGVPYHFAGRDAELSALNCRLAVVAETGDASDGLALITGVPGSGKTSLARAFMESCNVHTLRCDVVDFEDPPSLFLSIGTAIGKQSTFEKIAGVDPRITGGGLASVTSAKVSVTQQQTRPNLGLTAMLRMSKSKWKKPLLLVVDELQNLEASQAKPLRTLHEGVHGCPILAVGAGLQNTRTVLSRHGMSCVSRGIRLGLLSEDATCEVISESLAAFDIGAPTTAVDALAAASHDFPQHIHCYLTAAVDTVKDRKDWHRPSIRGEVVTKGDALRAEYYDDRLGAMAGDGHELMMPVIARMTKDSVQSLYRRDAIDAVGDNGEQTIDDAIQHGVLALEPGGRVTFGIPSFHRYMTNMLRQRERKPCSRPENRVDRGR